MNNPQVEEYIAHLNDNDASVRWTAAEELGEIRDAAAIPALLAALKDKHVYVRANASGALGKIGPPAVPALLKILKEEEEEGSVRHQAAAALRRIGDSATLPRKVLADSRLSAQQRIEVLDILCRFRFLTVFITLLYPFPDTRTLCQTVLNEADADARKGAQTVLNWLDGDQELLVASQPDPTNQAQELLRAAPGATSDSQPETLLRATDESEKNGEPLPTQPTLWERLFVKK